MTYLWQHPDWPNFYYDEDKIHLSSLYEYMRSASELMLSLERIPEDLRLDAMIDLMVKEAITTSAIEGEHLSHKDVRSSLKNHLGLTCPSEQVRDPRAKGISALMVTNYQRPGLTLSAETLFQWHRMILPRDYDSWGRKIRVGQWREDSIQVVSGPINKEIVHFEGPAAECVATEMDRFLLWYNKASSDEESNKHKPLPAPIRAALAHLWFVTIHPFDDGNGRIARAISDHALALDVGMPMIHSLSAAIEKHRNDYYEILEVTESGTMDVTQWVQWFIEITQESIAITKGILSFTIEKTNFIQQYKDQVNERQMTVLLYLFANGAEGDPKSVNRNKYVKQTHCSPRTALRDINDLVDKGALKQLPGKGRNTRYGLNLPSLFG